MLMCSVADLIIKSRCATLKSGIYGQIYSENRGNLDKINKQVEKRGYLGHFYL